MPAPHILPPSSSGDPPGWWQRLTPGQRAGLVAVAGLAAWSWSAPMALALIGVALYLWKGGKGVKLAICILLDLLDFTVGRILGFGIVFDAACTAVAVALWGWKGGFAALELLDPTEQLDAFVPTCTLIALSCWNKEA